MFLSTSGDTLVQYASDDLQTYQGGKFEEYNGLNTADFHNYGKFRGGGTIDGSLTPRIP